MRELAPGGLVISVQICYIACMSKQYNRSEPSKEQQKTRERIIAAASSVLAAKGYDAMVLREISREAQAASGLVHYQNGFAQLQHSFLICL
jgi:Bacterial regulatory proteins, tetR family